MVSMILAALYWIALHLGVAGPLRPALAGRLGETGFRGLFSLLSAVGLAWLIFAFRAAPLVPLWGPLPGAPVMRARRWAAIRPCTGPTPWIISCC